MERQSSSPSHQGQGRMDDREEITAPPVGGVDYRHIIYTVGVLLQQSAYQLPSPNQGSEAHQTEGHIRPIPIAGSGVPHRPIVQGHHLPAPRLMPTQRRNLFHHGQSSWPYHPPPPRKSSQGTPHPRNPGPIAGPPHCQKCHLLHLPEKACVKCYTCKEVGHLRKACPRRHPQPSLSGVVSQGASCPVRSQPVANTFPCQSCHFKHPPQKGCVTCYFCREVGHLSKNCPWKHPRPPPPPPAESRGPP